MYHIFAKSAGPFVGTFRGDRIDFLTMICHEHIQKECFIGLCVKQIFKAFFQICL